MIDRDAYEVLQVLPTSHQLVIHAAYRTLAALYHPDADDSLASNRRMAELNLAYAKVRTPDRRALYDRERKRRNPPAPPVVTPYQASGTRDPGAQPAHGVLDFGRYNGWTIAQIAREDPDYLKWLSRHSSGIRYRTAIEAALRDQPNAVVSERFHGRGKR